MVSRCSLYQLVCEIENVFSVLGASYTFSEEKWIEIKQAVLSERYVFSPLRFIVLPNDYPRDTFMHVLSVPDLPNVSFAVFAESEENVVFFALSRVLSIAFSSSFLENSLAFRPGKEGRKGFYGEVFRISSLQPPPISYIAWGFPLNDWFLDGWEKNSTPSVLLATDPFMGDEPAPPMISICFRC